MGLFSFLRKNKQESASGDSEFYSHAEEESVSSRGRGKRKRSATSNDPVLPEKKRARRRLIGALALVMAAVIGLPMILDAEPQPLADDIVIHIPSKEQQSPQPAPPAENAAAPVAVTSSQVPVTDTLDHKEELVEAPAELSSPGDAKESGRKEPMPEVAAVTREQPAVKVPEKSSEKLPEKKSDKSAEATRALAILEGKFDGKTTSSTDASTKKAGQFVVQVAALSSKDKVDELRGKLKNAGISSHTQMVATKTGDHTRVRVGPFASREEADGMRTKLVAMGLNGTIVPLNQ